MYIPSQFRQAALPEVKEFLKAHSFGILINQVSGRLWGTHIPLLLTSNSRGEDVLEGHMAKANPAWKSFTEESETLAIFSGPHAYISSSWYDHPNVPTWNYIAVHIYGRIRLLNEEEVYHSLKRLVDTYEAASDQPVSVERMPEDLLQREVRALVGFEIKIDEIQAAWKLSQNRDEKNHASIVQELSKKENAGAQQLAFAMKNSRKQKDE